MSAINLQQESLPNCEMVSRTLVISNAANHFDIRWDPCSEFPMNLFTEYRRVLCAFAALTGTNIF